METRLYVGNLSPATTSEELQALFSPHGTVNFAQVVADRDSGRSDGFGFVEMATPEEAEAAVTALNGASVGEQVLVVELARGRPSGRERGYHGGPHPWTSQD